MICPRGQVDLPGVSNGARQRLQKFEESSFSSLQFGQIFILNNLHGRPGQRAGRERAATKSIAERNGASAHE
jgi:hypothetical protein